MQRRAEPGWSLALPGGARAQKFSTSLIAFVAFVPPPIMKACVYETRPARETLLGSAKECVETPPATGEVWLNCSGPVTRSWPYASVGPSAGRAKP